MGLRLKDQLQHSYADYLSWSGDDRYELLNGLAYLMSPAPDLVHQEVVGEIYLQARLALQDSCCRAFIAPLDVRLPKQNQDDAAIDTVVQPDVLVVCDSNKLDKRGICGAPDWVVEVLSPATASHDQIKKRLLYEQHGVCEYWLVHPIDRVLIIYRLQEGEYGKPDILPLEGETIVSSLPAIVIRWDKLLKRLPYAY